MAETIPADDDALTVPVQSASTPSAVRAGTSETTASKSESHSLAPQNRAIIAVSVIMALAMVAVLVWFWWDYRRDRVRKRERERETRLLHSPRFRSVLPLQTSFHPSFKSSFGFTGASASPDSPWSRTDATITPLTRAAGQESPFSPMTRHSPLTTTASPQRANSPTDSTLPPPPVTANTTRTFRTSIRSIMVNRDSATTAYPTLSADLFPISPPGARPRLTRPPSYHTEYSKSMHFKPDEKRGFLPGPVDEETNTTVPPLPTPTPAPITNQVTPPPPRTPKMLPPIRTRVRDSELEYLRGGGTPSSTSSVRASANTSLPPASARPAKASRGESLSEDLRGLLFLGSSVTVHDRPIVKGPADPDLSPTAGWFRLSNVGNGRRLV